MWIKMLCIAALLLIAQVGTHAETATTLPAEAWRNQLISHKTLPVKPVSNTVAMSPDGKWLAFPRYAGGCVGIAFYNLKSGRTWIVDKYRSKEGEKYTRWAYEECLIVWRKDSRACAVCDTKGLSIVWPSRKRILRLTREPADFENCVAWSPRTNKLAAFIGGDGPFLVWDGHKVLSSGNWTEATGWQLCYPWSGWDCEWSPDERAVLLRFYGSSGRDRSGTGHLEIMNSKTAHRQGKWGAQALAPHWIDSSRVAYLVEDGPNIYGSLPLMVAHPRSGSERGILQSAYDISVVRPGNTVWISASSGFYRLDTRSLKPKHVLKSVCAWDSAERTGRVWAVTEDAKVYRLGASGSKKTLICGLSGPMDPSKTCDWSIHVSPDERSFAFCWSDRIGDYQSGRRYLCIYQLKGGKAQFGRFYPYGKVLGWAQGQTLPLILRTEGYGDKNRQVWQVK